MKKYKIDKPIRLIELFAGYGSQALALKYLGANFEHWKICEWATKSIQAYNDLHIQDKTDYSEDFDREDVENFLFNAGISMDYNKPMTYEQIKRKGESWQRQTFNNIMATHNLVDISKAHAKDLEMVETDKYEYIWTYSFPCQDLSVAGTKNGMEKGKGTRSGLLWEVERILRECEELPQVLLMENVPQVHGNSNASNFRDWEKSLEDLGYTNRWMDLNAKDFGIPQGRKRCFMVSILGDYDFKFPEIIPSKIGLLDVLDTEFDKKYLMSDKLFQCFTREESEGSKFPRKARFIQALKLTNEKNIAGTLTTSGGTRSTDNFVVVPRDPKRSIPICEDTLPQLKLRRFTPLESFRLMGVRDTDSQNVQANQSNASMYHLAGDSICASVLMAIFGELLGIDYKEKIDELVADLIQI